MHVQPSLRSDTEEYDSLGSDSDSRADERPHNFHPTYLHSNIRHSKYFNFYSFVKYFFGIKLHNCNQGQLE